MQHPLEIVTFAMFLLAFVVMWLLVSAILTSGARTLARAYPDREEVALVKLRGESGKIGDYVNFRGVLNLSGCRSGLRVSIARMFDPFGKPFFVPWAGIAVEKKKKFFEDQSKLSFGQPVVGTMTIDALSWRRLSESAAGAPPDLGGLASIENRKLAVSLLLQWIVGTTFAATFFYVFSHVIARDGALMPVSVCIGFPGAILGFDRAKRYFVGRRRSLRK